MGVSDVLCCGHVLGPLCGVGGWEGCFTLWFLEVGNTSHEVNIIGNPSKEGCQMLGSLKKKRIRYILVCLYFCTNIGK